MECWSDDWINSDLNIHTFGDPEDALLAITLQVRCSIVRNFSRRPLRLTNPPGAFIAHRWRRKKREERIEDGE